MSADDLERFRRPMEPIPERVERAIAAGVQAGPDVPFAGAGHVLVQGGGVLEDAVVRNSDGILVVACRTEMPGVTPEMWDWWFGWHLPSSERYRLWHPKAHVKATVREDRAHVRDDRARYVGNVSFVDEYIGPDLVKLSIAFREPSAFGFDAAQLAKVGTAICARVGLRGTPLDTGRLIHLVRRTEGGSEMISRFWLADVAFAVPALGALISPLFNRRAARLSSMPDAAGLHLLRHCAEEMHHLASFLPELYREMSGRG
jgi:hypothetical protein